jgi:hypothetical protein
MTFPGPWKVLRRIWVTPWEVLPLSLRLRLSLSLKIIIMPPFPEEGIPYNEYKDVLEEDA